MSAFLSEEEIKIFKNLIDGYQINPAAKAEFLVSHFAIIAGPTGAGKDTLRNHLISDNPDKYGAILSTTTRPPRQNEQDNLDYHFKSKLKVKRSLEIGEFFQAALVHNQQVSCLHIDEIKKLTSRQIGLSILIVQTERELFKIKSDIKTIFIIPPDFNELKRRIQSSRGISKSEMNRRLSAAKTELGIALEEERYYCIVNDNLNEAISLARKFFEDGTRDNEHDKNARRIISRIYSQIGEV